MNILFVLENYYPHIGGVEVLFKNLAEGLAKKGHEISVLTHKIKGTKKFEVVNGVKIYRVNCFYSRYLFTFLSIPKAIRLAKKADLIHTTTFNGAFPAWIASKLLNKRCIITIHEVWINRWNKLTEMNVINAWFHNILERLIYFLRFDKYVAVSKSTKEHLLNLGIKDKKISIVYNGIDYNHWSPKKYNREKIRDLFGLGNRFVYFFSGRPGTSKGLEYLIKAVPIVSKIVPNSVLLALVSKDKAYKRRFNFIISLIKRLDIDNKIIIKDPVSYKDLPYYVKSADCVVVPSLAEGFGFAIAEACAMGIPVVATDTGSIPEVISGKFVLVNPRDEKSIAEGIVKVYNGSLKAAPIKKFEIKDNIKGYLSIYDKVIR